MSNLVGNQGIVEHEDSTPSSSKPSSSKAPVIYRECIIHCLTVIQTRTLRERKKRVVHADVEPDNDEDEYDDKLHDDCTCSP